MTSPAASAERLLGLAGPLALTGCCSAPAAERFDAAALVTTDRNRWSDTGEPTLYLAGDPGVALAEVGRHWQAGGGRQAIWEVRFSLRAAIDLRRSDLRAAVGIPEDPRWFLDRGRCRDLAARLRVGGADGLIVPSVAFLDDLQRWDAVLFADRLGPLDQVVLGARVVYEIGPA